MRRFACITAFIVFALAFSACDKKQTALKRVRVNGSVTLDNKALTTGTVTFDSESGEPPGSFPVVDGKYEGVAAVGKNRVRITAVQKVSMKDKMKMDGPGYDQMTEENLLPARYADGTLTREVLESGNNTFDFDLKSK